ncbi:HAD family phosphatase [Pararcticibacter amylolyticus]|uniref:HAD family phosphatase n=2 Tax=Pararcticibacter amylolyticus TaxID=2173175 RepID=A0A2U2PB59_9SPHI|nr:HAD family phosphatase [Pararcticibacter amylolyticus]
MTKLQALTQLSKGDYKAFLYDCDGTLADNMQAHKDTYVKVALDHGVTIDPAIIDEFAGLPIVRVVEEINKRYQCSLDPVTFNALKYDLYYNEYIQHIRPVEFVTEHLKVHAGKVRIGVVSGGSRDAIEKTLEILEIRDLVEVLVCAGETERGKPYPDPFLLAAEMLETDPQYCLVFEDGEAGVKAADDAGMDWIRIDKVEGT